MNLDSTIERTLAYHQRTKHHLQRYARSPGYVDWATQPDPFRTDAGAPRIELDLLADRVTSSYGNLFRPGAVPPQPIAVETIGILFELSLGLSALDIVITNMRLVGNYAIQIDWSDGHTTGIYTWKRLRELCPCSKCKSG